MFDPKSFVLLLAGVKVPSPAISVTVPPKATELEPMVIAEVSTRAYVPVELGKVRVLFEVTVPALSAT